jgi:Uma2 family endonuclease
MKLPQAVGWSWLAIHFVVIPGGNLRFGLPQQREGVPISSISVEQYRHSHYEPDMDYIDGVLQERNTCLLDHSEVQGMLATTFRIHGTEWNVQAYLSLRVQVGPTRFRIADVCVMPTGWKRLEQKTPLLCLEVKSEEYSLEREAARAQDYLALGVREVWIFDPEKRAAYVLRGETMTEQREGSLRLSGTAIELDLAALFAVLDE